jgi:hypothetical protein
MTRSFFISILPSLKIHLSLAQGQVWQSRYACSAHHLSIAPTDKTILYKVAEAM